MQETLVWSLIWEDPTCHGATQPAHTGTDTEPQSLGPKLCSARSPPVRSPHTATRERRLLATPGEKPKQQWRARRVKKENKNFKEKSRIPFSLLLMALVIFAEFLGSDFLKLSFSNYFGFITHNEINTIPELGTAENTATTMIAVDNNLIWGFMSMWTPRNNLLFSVHII